MKKPLTPFPATGVFLATGKQVTASDFIFRFNLGNSATVLRSLNSLLRMELIYRENDREGKSYYGIYDILFSRWLGWKES